MTCRCAVSSPSLNVACTRSASMKTESPGPSVAASCSSHCSTPGFDEGLGFGVAVAATAVPHLEVRERGLEPAGGERRSVVGAECEFAGPDPVRGDGGFDHSDRFVGAAAE